MLAKEKTAAEKYIAEDKAKREADLRAKANFKRERAQNIRSLETPNPAAGPDPLQADTGPTESITYYSPVQRKWVVEHIQV